MRSASLSGRVSRGVSAPGDEFIFRSARPQDKADILAFTAHTWEFGDYIEHVLDDWLADKNGCFLVAQEARSGRIAAIDKLTLLSPTEAWFEGLRVNPDFRGRGLATRLQQHMIGQARSLGARTIRFLTLVTNLPIHRNAYRDGFSMRLVARFWKWADSERPSPEEQASQEAAYKLRPVTHDEAGALFAWWERSSAFRTQGLVHRNWSFSATAVGEWSDRAEQGLLFVPQQTPVAEAVLPPPAVLVSPDKDEQGRPIWVLSAVSALGAEWEEMGRALIEVALGRNIIEINGLLSDDNDIFSGLQRAGFTPDPDDERLCLFELSLSAKDEGRTVVGRR